MKSKILPFGVGGDYIHELSQKDYHMISVIYRIPKCLSQKLTLEWCLSDTGESNMEGDAGEKWSVVLTVGLEIQILESYCTVR